MIEHTFNIPTATLHIRPSGPLKKEDFEGLARQVDPFIEKHGDLAGLIVEIGEFPGWDTLGAMGAHLRFVRDHHRHIRKIALVTDAAIGTVAEKLASHFVAATIKHFPAGQVDAARKWIASPAAA